MLQPSRLEGVSSKYNLRFVRVFNASRELVWKAWTQPERLAQWWGPREFTNEVQEFDLRYGGALLIIMRSPEGIGYPMPGRFDEILEPERLVFSCGALNTQGKLMFELQHTVSLVVRGSKTTLTLESRLLMATDEAEPYLDGFEIGMTQSLERLCLFLLSKK